MKRLFSQTKISHFGGGAPRKIDLFLCCASFEERSTVIPRALKERRPIRSIVFFVEDFKEKSKSYLSTIMQSLGTSTEQVSLSYFDQIQTGESIVNSISSSLSKSRMHVGIDISTFTHEHLLILLKVLHNNSFRIAKLHLFYLGAKEYSIGDSMNSKWLSKGVLGTRSILGYPGEFDANSKTQLIGLMGFEAIRMAATIEKYQPNIVNLGRGHKKGSLTEEHYNASTYWHNFVRQSMPNISEFEFDPKDPTAISDNLGELCSPELKFNTIIAPLCTKLSTVGVGLFALFNPKIRLCYTPVIEYNFKNYSTPADDVFIVSITGNWTDLFK